LEKYERIMELQEDNKGTTPHDPSLSKEEVDEIYRKKE